MFRTVLFDFDGTLIPSLDFWLDGFKYAFDKLGVGVTEEEIIKRCFYKKDVEIVEAFKLNSVESFWKHTEESLSRSYATPTLFPGVREVLGHCRDNNITVGLVTSSERSFVHSALNTMEIAHHFATVVTANDVKNFKPHPEPVLQALSHLEADASTTLFVGDYVVDVQSGKAAGTSTGLFFTERHRRFHQYEHVASSQPDFIFSDYQDLLSKLKSADITPLKRSD